MLYNNPPLRAVSKLRAACFVTAVSAFMFGPTLAALASAGRVSCDRNEAAYVSYMILIGFAFIDVTYALLRLGGLFDAVAKEAHDCVFALVAAITFGLVLILYLALDQDPHPCTPESKSTIHAWTVAYIAGLAVAAAWFCAAAVARTALSL